MKEKGKNEEGSEGGGGRIDERRIRRDGKRR